MADQKEVKLQIRLHVYDTDLTVRIPREDEEYYRKSAKLIDEIVNSYSKIFKGRVTFFPSFPGFILQVTEIIISILFWDNDFWHPVIAKFKVKIAFVCDLKGIVKSLWQ